jgi:hypothetical protein
VDDEEVKAVSRNTTIRWRKQLPKLVGDIWHMTYPELAAVADLTVEIMHDYHPRGSFALVLRRETNTGELRQKVYGAKDETFTLSNCPAWNSGLALHPIPWHEGNEERGDINHVITVAVHRLAKLMYYQRASHNFWAMETPGYDARLRGAQLNPMFRIPARELTGSKMFGMAFPYDGAPEFADDSKAIYYFYAYADRIQQQPREFAPWALDTLRRAQRCAHRTIMESFEAKRPMYGQQYSWADPPPSEASPTDDEVEAWRLRMQNVITADLISSTY